MFDCKDIFEQPAISTAHFINEPVRAFYFLTQGMMEFLFFYGLFEYVGSSNSDTNQFK